MTREVSARARELAARLAALFRSDTEIVARLNDAQSRLRHANDRLWSGLHPDGLGLVYDDGRRVVVGVGPSAIAALTSDTLRTGGTQPPLESGLLEALQQAHWAIHRAFCDFQSACEERRRLAVDVGELSWQLTEALCVAGWTEDAARDADVHELAGAGAR